MSIIKSPTLMTGEVPPYTINQSIRFEDTTEHFMTSPTPSSSKNFTTTATISLWFKLGNTNQGYLAGAFYGSNSRYNLIQLNASGQLQENDRVGGASTSNGSGGTAWTTTRVFKDPSAWYHAVFVWDTTNSVQSERFKLYINGVRETNFATAPALGASELVYWFGKSSYTTLGAYFNGTGYADLFYFDGYLAEMHGVDGTALDQNSFGQFNSSGIWTPIEYTGSHGTDGFYIKGEDASALGTNSASNGNNFTLNAISSHDQVLDTPTNNFAVMNPNDANGLAANELTGGNLQVKNVDRIRSSLPFPTSGKWYWEICTVSNGGQVNWNYGMVYFKDHSEFLTTNTDFIRLNWYHGSNFSSSSNWTDGDFWTNSNNPSAGDVYGFAWDSDTKKVWLAKNNTYFGSGNPAGNTGTPWGSGGTAGVEYGIAMYSTQNFIHTINFGQDDTFNGAKSGGSSASDDNGSGKFFYAPPTGFLALCTKNLGAD
tara:strand:- start:19744 stop:21195 length:1452 start_codon:yes stop_codon:yes gene_type:complete